jgi:hypothetical protein
MNVLGAFDRLFTRSGHGHTRHRNVLLALLPACGPRTNDRYVDTEMSLFGCVRVHQGSEAFPEIKAEKKGEVHLKDGQV